MLTCLRIETRLHRNIVERKKRPYMSFMGFIHQLKQGLILTNSVGKTGLFMARNIS